jgi:hypothetical protein
MRSWAIKPADLFPDIALGASSKFADGNNAPFYLDSKIARPPLLTGALKRGFARFQRLQRRHEKIKDLDPLGTTPGLFILLLCFFDATPHIRNTSVQPRQFMRIFPHEGSVTGARQPSIEQDQPRILGLAAPAKFGAMPG